jgi:hypothetical protein
MGRKSVLHIHASKKPGAGEVTGAGESADIWTIEVGGQCHVVASGEWE